MKGNKEFIKKILNEYDKKNFFNLDYIADDIKWNIIGDTTIIGKKNFLQAIEMEERESLPVITIKNVIAEKEYVVVESKGKTATKGGKPYRPAYCDIYRIKNGKIQEMTTYFINTASNKNAIKK
jgi:uncharacterized protein